jgi:PAS domain S-box-containing protein
MPFLGTIPAYFLLGMLGLPLIFLAYQFSPTLSHNFAETFSVVVAIGTFMMVWNARRFLDSHFYLFLGIAYLFVGGVDYLHALSFDGLFRRDSPNLHAQFWYVARYLQSAALLIAPAFVDRKLKPSCVIAVFSAVTALMLACIMIWDIFPAFFTNGTNATWVKTASVASVAAAQGAAIVLLSRKRKYFDARVYRLLVGSILFSIATEFAGELYSDAIVYNNLFGHYLKIISFYLVYKAVIATGLLRPYDLLFRDLKRSEEGVRTERDELETRVAERMAELKGLNEQLERELADRRRAETAVRESEDRFRSLVENSLVGILIVQDARVVFRNPEPERYLGPIPEGISFRELGEVHPEDLPKFELLCKAMTEDTSANHVTEIRVFPEGKEPGGEAMKWIHIRTNPIGYRGRMATLVNMVDITRVKDLEQIAVSREKLASLGQLAAGIAHEIRNPLSGINVNVSALEHLCRRFDGMAAEEEAKIGATVGKIRIASEKIATVIRRVMEFSKPVPPRLGLVDVNGVIGEAIQMSAVSLQRNGIELRKILAPDLPRCQADSRLLEQVLLNLIANAIQAMENVDGRRQLEVTSSLEGDRVVATVADSGPGIPPHLRAKVFDPFYTTRRDGHGIGLSFSHRIMTDHHGSLTVSVSRWGGAEFRIEIPLEKTSA